MKYYIKKTAKMTKNIYNMYYKLLEQYKNDHKGL